MRKMMGGIRRAGRVIAGAGKRLAPQRRNVFSVALQSQIERRGSMANIQHFEDAHVLREKAGLMKAKVGTCKPIYDVGPFGTVFYVRTRKGVMPVVDALGRRMIRINQVREIE